MEADGTGLRQVTDDLAADHAPAWSLDGRRIVFHSTRNENFDLFVVNADGTGLRQLTDDPAHETFPEWSPDGKRIAFAKIFSLETFDFYPGPLMTMEAGGEQIRTVFDGPGDDGGGSSWQPFHDA